MEIYIRKYRSLNKMSTILFKILGNHKSKIKTERNYLVQLFNLWKFKVNANRQLDQLK
jgi:hypothetical protein